MGKNPGRYKLVAEGTIFYNPMRILLGSIAFIDEGDAPGITSPDHVVFKTHPGLLHPRWFYYWLRSPRGDAFIKTLTRGAVRERMLFRRLSQAEVDLPAWEAQLVAAKELQNNRSLVRRGVEELDSISKLPAALLRRAFNEGL
jgi:type I restriction enzyme S subunit